MGGEYLRLSRGRPGFGSPPGRLFFGQSRFISCILSCCSSSSSRLFPHIHSPLPPPLPLPLPLILPYRRGSRQSGSRVVNIIAVVDVKKDCIGRESNPGRPRSAHILNGRRAFYH